MSTYAHTLRIHRVLPSTRVEGPGLRACIWVQGCPIRCPGCAVPRTWSASGGETRTVASLARQVLAGPPVEGVTFVGGEPFAQAEALAALGRRVRAHGLSVVTFSGYEWAHLRAAERADWQALLEVTDLLIDGPYVAGLADTSRPWVGSSNQRYRFLTDRYADLEPRLAEIPNGVEIRVTPDGDVLLNGLASPEELARLLPPGFVSA